MIWSGIYPSFSDAVKDLPTGHAPDQWVRKSLERLTALRDPSIVNPGKFFSADPLALFPPLMALLSKNKNIAVTDVGGNLGQLSIWVEKWIAKESLTWRVVETPELLDHPLTQDAFSPSVRWFRSLEDVPAGTNLLNFGSSLQYIEHLEDGVFPFLRNHKPEWVVIGDAMVGSTIPTFITRQNYYEVGFAAKFRNLAELTEEFAQEGYTLRLIKSALNAHNKHYYPSDGLPEEYQIQYPLDLAFERTD